MHKGLARPDVRADSGHMRQVVYAGGSFVTSDEVADAVLQYAAALANAGRAATINVPAVDEFGDPSDVHLLVGPSSQLMAEIITRDGAGPDGEAFVGIVAARTSELRRTFVPRDGESTVDWDI